MLFSVGGKPAFNEPLGHGMFQADVFPGGGGRIGQGGQILSGGGPEDGVHESCGPGTGLSLGQIHAGVDGGKVGDAIHEFELEQGEAKDLNHHGIQFFKGDPGVGLDDLVQACPAA